MQHILSAAHIYAHWSFCHMPYNALGSSTQLKVVLASFFLSSFPFNFLASTKFYIYITKRMYVCVWARVSAGWRYQVGWFNCFSINDNMIVGHCFPIVYRSIPLSLTCSLALVHYFDSDFPSSLSSSIFSIPAFIRLLCRDPQLRTLLCHIRMRAKVRQNIETAMTGCQWPVWLR